MRVERGRVPREGLARTARAFSAAMAQARATAEGAEAASPRAGGSVGEPGTAEGRPVPGASGAPRRNLDDGEPEGAAIASPAAVASGDGRREGAVAPAPSAMAAAPLDRLAVELAQGAGVPSLTLAFGGEGPLVRITKQPGGVEIALELPPSCAAGSTEELLALAAAVRAQGVAVVGGSVRIRGAAARPLARALTAGRGSYRTAAQSERGGTVAKW